MRKSRFNESQREAIVSNYLKGVKTVDALCEEHQISPATFYKWKNELQPEKDEGKRRLKKMYAELQLKHEVMSDAVDILKKLQAQKQRRR